MRGVDPFTIIGFLTVLHGLAHLVPVSTAITSDRTTIRWLRGNSAGAMSAVSAPRDLVVAVFSACTAGFVLGGLAATGWIVSPSWWRPFTDSAAVLSAVAFITFSDAYPTKFRYEVFGLVLDVVIIANWLQLMDWPV